MIVQELSLKVNAEREDHLNPLDMFRREHIIKTMILLLCWNTTVISFYALTLNSTKLHGDSVLNFLICKAKQQTVTLLDIPFNSHHM